MTNWDADDFAQILIIVFGFVLCLGTGYIINKAMIQRAASYQNALTTVIECRQKQVRLSGPVGLDAVCGPIPRREDF
jgi:hypothetical protein